VVSKAISEALALIPFEARSAAVALSSSSVITKTIQLSAELSDEEIESLLLSEADRYIPYAIDEVSFDYEVLGPTLKNDSLMDVLLVASRTDNVNSRVDVVENAGIEVSVVDVESYAVERACKQLVDELPDRGKDKTIAVIDIGHSMISITVLHDLKCIFSRDEVYGGHQLTKAIQRYYDISYAEAGYAKKSGDLPEDYAEKVLKPYTDTLLLQIRRGLQVFFSASLYNSIDYIVIAGGVANIPGLDDKIAELFKVNVSIANPFKNMSVAAAIDKQRLLDEAPSLFTALGLALREGANYG